MSELKSCPFCGVETDGGITVHAPDCWIWLRFVKNCQDQEQICAAWNRRAPEAGQFDSADLEALAAIEKGGREYADKIRKIVGDPMTSIEVNTVTGKITTHKPQAQAEPKPDKVVVGYTPGTDSMSIEIAEGQEPAAWRIYTDCWEHYDNREDAARNMSEWSDNRDKPFVAPEPLYAQPQRPAVPEGWRQVIENVGKPYKKNSFADDLLQEVYRELEKLTAAPAPEQSES